MSDLQASLKEIAESGRRCGRVEGLIEAFKIAEECGALSVAMAIHMRIIGNTVSANAPSTESVQ